MSTLSKVVAGMMIATTTTVATYILTNKNTKKKMDKLICTMIDETNDMIAKNTNE